uniref:HTH CENPB-type domain-containing protein n=1 Tax=Amblyomma maculatum TaxID=34609 RepID=G3MQ63_AMBMU
MDDGDDSNCDVSAGGDQLYAVAGEPLCPDNTRKRTAATASEKRELCLWKRNHPRSTLQDVVLWTRINLGLDIGKSTVSRILQESDKWISTMPNTASSTNSRNQLVAEVETSLVSWLQGARSRGVYVSDMMIVEKARSLGKLLKMPDDFRYSRGWLHRFKKRHGISCSAACGEDVPPGSASCHELPQECDASTDQVQLRTVLADYSLKNIYHLQEIVFSYAAMPAKGTARGKQTHAQQRLVVGLLYNISSSHRWRPIVISSAKRPHSFGSLFDPDIYCSYHHEPRMQLTADILSSELKRLDESLCKERRHAVVLIDGAKSDSLSDTYFCNLQVQCLPPQCVSDISTMKTSAEHGVKAVYRKDLVMHSVMCKDAGLQDAVSIRWALRALSQAWMALPSQVISDSWSQTGLLPFQLAKATDSNAYESLVIELQQVLDIFSPGSDAASYISLDDCGAMNSCPPAAFRERPECIASILEPNCIDAWRGLHTLISYLEQEGDVNTVQDLCRLERNLNRRALK